MTNAISLTLQGVSLQLPDGSFLFSDLDEVFDHRHTGLVGRNGVGKSVLARVLAGELKPSRGRCTRTGSVHYLPQQIAPDPGLRVADLAGLRSVVDALDRIERGSTRQQDFDIVGERWDIESTLRQALAGSGLGHLHVETPATQLSGGEAMRVALAGAFLSGADMLILDEPSNHLDREQRVLLHAQLQRWPGGLIVVSHDRALLEALDNIIELSEFGLRRYGGGYSFYAQTKARERAGAEALLDRRRLERRRGARELSRQRERLERRQSRGSRQAAQANQAAILLGLQKQRSENSAGKLRAAQDAARAALDARVHEAATQVEAAAPIVLFAPGTEQALPDRVAGFDGLVLPYPQTGGQAIDLRLSGAQRIALLGANGSGKSTLLKVLAGLIAPRAGRCARFVETAYLDQRLSLLDAESTLLEQLLSANPRSSESALRSRLALLGLDAAHLQVPVSVLSGGERLKAALAKVMYAERPAQLLLLDEPDNHLDLPSLEALEAMLRQYRGALVVVSHDAAFLANLALTHRLEPHDGTWRMTAWT